MRWAAARLLAGLCLGWCVLAGACAADLPPLLLHDAEPTVDVQKFAQAWVDPRGEAGIDEVSRPTALQPFRPAAPGASYRLGDAGALWLHLTVARAPGDRQDWLLEVPMPLVDEVTLYQREAGGWHAESAGDTLAVRRWPEAGRYPVFRLDLGDGEVRELYLRIRHERGADFPVRLETESLHDQQLQLEYAGLGGTFGAMVLLIAACLAWSWAFHDRAFAWYAVYVLLATLAVAAFTGAAAHLLWPGFDALRDAPTSMLSCATVAAALLFVRNTLGLRRRMPLQDSIVLALAATGAVLTVLPAFAEKAVYLPLVGGYITLASVSVLGLAGAAWWRGDVVGRWVFAAHAPMVVAAVTAAFRVLGWAHIPFVAQNLVVGALAIEVPLLLVALFIRSRDRHSAEIREQALSTHDALTGLLAPHLFHDRLRQVIARHRRGDEGAAVMYIELVNHGRIRDYFGGAVADQSLLRSVIKLRRLLGDADTVSRLGEARFGVILEGATQRSSVTERASRLIAGGLMPLPGLKPEVTLQFHVAALLLHELPLEPEQVDAALAEQLARMSPRTRRPIRFLSPGRSASDSGDSSMFAPEADLPRPPVALQVVASRT